MSALLTASVLSTLFVQPLHLPAGTRLWMMLPLIGCVAVVYRATRVRSPREMPWATTRTFFSIVVGMGLIAVAFYLAHLAARRFF
jgi:hypothetical protein